MPKEDQKIIKSTETLQYQKHDGSEKTNNYSTLFF